MSSTPMNEPLSGRSVTFCTKSTACTYTAADYQAVLTAQGITCSMSRTGDCYDNAVMESFFSTVKRELGEHFDSGDNARHQLFDFIEVFYNQRRRHSTLGQISPAAFERQAGAVDAAVPVDAKTASTSDLENRKKPRFSTASTAVIVLYNSPKATTITP